MTPDLAYFLKVNVALVLFYAFYRLFFYKDTFFKLRRTILVIFFGLSVAYPLLNIQEWVKQQEPIAEVITMYSTMLPEITADSTPQAINWQSSLTQLLLAAYWTGVVVLTIRFLLQLGSILRLALLSKRQTIQGAGVFALDKPTGPFSFFRLIFIHPASHSEKETEEILAHEHTHVSQWHSFDVLLSEIIGIFCWINPFAWLLKREVRHNLEYLADNTVIQSGFDSKSYQCHLLGLAHHHQAAANLYTSFNVLHLKNRINMMNKKRSRAIGKTKYLIFLPLAAMLMILSNIEAVARVTNELTNDLIVSSEDNTVVAEVGTNETITPPFADEPKVNQDNQKKKTIFTQVEHMPVFPGGEAELLKFIGKSIKYPKEAQEKKIEGRVVCRFVVNEDGTVSDPEIVRGLNPLLDQEAIRVIKTMPKWTPGTQKGQAVAVRYTVPVTYKLANRNDNPLPAKQASSTGIAEGSDPNNPVYNVVEKMPEFAGGEAKLLQFIAQGIKYPKEAEEKGKQGIVIATYIIEKDGSITNAKIVKGIDPLLDQEAIRVIKTMPKWTPGMNKGKTVRTKYTIPITFRLQ